MVSKKIGNIHHDLGDLQSDLAKLSERLLTSRKPINNALLITTPAPRPSLLSASRRNTGQPPLLQKLADAQDSLVDWPATSTANDLSVRSHQSRICCLLRCSKARGLWPDGAVEEDRSNWLNSNSINSTVIIIDRIQNNVNDDITRASTYLATERNNLRTIYSGWQRRPAG